MKFENIKVGDTVCTQKYVKYAWNSYESFYITEEVVRVTKTQFVVESGDRYRKDGRKIGEYFQGAYFEGDETSGYPPTKVKDETAAMEKFKLKLNVEATINKQAEDIRIPLNSKLALDYLLDIKSKLNEITTLLKR